MNSRISKKIRQVNRRSWKRTFKELKASKFRVRWAIAWWLIFGRK